MIYILFLVFSLCTFVFCTYVQLKSCISLYLCTLVLKYIYVFHISLDIYMSQKFTFCIVECLHFALIRYNAKTILGVSVGKRSVSSNSNLYVIWAQTLSEVLLIKSKSFKCRSHIFQHSLFMYFDMTFMRSPKFESKPWAMLNEH